MKLVSFRSKVCNVHIGVDETSAEQWAMLAAMFSRSIDGAEEIAKKITAEKSSRFMDQFYIGYGHASIGDLADIKVFVEGVPFYIACQLEHFSRFRGQESSTRYIDFSKQPCAFDANQAVYDNQIIAYLRATELVRANIEAANPPTVEIERDVSAYNAFKRAINARTFDICRGLLPWGATTNVAWYGDIRTITQHLAWLISYQNPNAAATNIRAYVEQIHAAIAEVYPSSVKVLENARPAKPWPYPISDRTYQLDHVDYPLDFGSWRDLNRHRIGRHVVNFNSLSENLHPWYVAMYEKHGVEVPPPIMGINTALLSQCVPYYYIADADQFRYIHSLRSKTSVHPTLRRNVQKHSVAVGMDSDVVDSTPDVGPFGFYMQRGNDTIIMKGES